jgi:hypothetical protein
MWDNASGSQPLGSTPGVVHKKGLFATSFCCRVERTAYRPWGRKHISRMAELRADAPDPHMPNHHNLFASALSSLLQKLDNRS